MAFYINKGNAGFSSVLNSRFVDKSLLIERVNSVILTESRYMCVTRARRFGKSVAVKMLNAYYDQSCDSSKLFENLKIGSTIGYKKHLNQYPVIYLDMTDFLTKYGNDPLLVEKMKRDIIQELLNLYPKVTMDEGEDLMDLLVKIVLQTGRRFICLIDEWDALCREGHEDLMDAYVDLLRRLFKGSNTESVFACVYMTGILPIKRYNTQSALNNFEEYTMLSPADLAPYFGFTESEVEELCKTDGIDMTEMKRWYDGYQIGTKAAMFNPYAVMRALKRRCFEDYWTSTNAFESLKRYLTMNFEGLKDDVVSLLADIPISVNHLRFSNDMHQIESKDDVLTLLCHLGYLSYNQETQQANIPNYEVRNEFEVAIAASQWKEVNEALQQSEALMIALLSRDSDAVAEAIERIHQENTSILTYNNESSLACVLSLALYTVKSRYRIVREYPLGKGFADLVLIPHRDIASPAIVIELKYNQSTESAIDQIRNKQYAASLADYSGQVLLVGINYDRKSKHHTCSIETISK